MTHKEKHSYKTGQKLHLDDIYHISGIGMDSVGEWWEADDEDGEEITITKDIDITITIKIPS